MIFALAEHEAPGLAGLAQRIGLGRVANLLVKHMRRGAPPSRLQLLPEAVDHTIHEATKMKPLFVGRSRSKPSCLTSGLLVGRVRRSA